MRKIFSCTLLLLSACATSVGDVVSEYKNTARSIGLTPVYPPEESLQVGDIFVQSIPKTDEADDIRDDVNDSVKVLFGSSDDFVKAAEEHMRNRVAFLRTNEVSGGNNDKSQRDTVGGAIKRRKELLVESLPIVAFPEVTADAGTNFGFSVVKVLQSIGVATGQRTQVILNFNDVRKYGIPKLQAYTPAYRFVVSEFRKRVKATAIAQSKGFDTINKTVEDAIRGSIVSEKQRLSLVKSSRRNSLAPMSERCKRFLVITEVYMTRTITYTFQNAQILALAAKKLEDTADSKSSVKSGAAPALTNVVINGPALKDSEGNSISPITLADPASIRSAVQNSVNQDATGKGLVFDAFTARGARFSQTFERPVVIGFDAVPVGYPTDASYLKTEQCIK